MASRESATNGEGFDNLPLRIGLGQFKQPTEDRLRYIRQLGVNDILLNMYDTPLLEQRELPLTGDDEWSYRELVQLRNRVEDYGLRLNAIENFPIRFYSDVMLAGEKRDEQLDHLKNTVEKMGDAGIPILGYHWGPSGVWRTSTSRRVRGGARSTGFTRREIEGQPLTHDRAYSEEEIWENYRVFLEEILPVAEEAGVKLALHPNDPPVEEVGGIPFIFRNLESFERAMDMVPSKNHGLELCLGTWSEMGEDVVDVVEHFGRRNEIFYVHFRNVRGSVPEFTETFIDDGDFDPHRVLEALYNVGFSGMVIPDHVPEVIGDTDWKHRARGHAVGYLQGLLRSIERHG